MVIYSLILMATFLSAHSTHFFIKRKGWTSVRASAFCSVFFILMTGPLPFPEASLLQTAFLGASFIGMSHPDKFRFHELNGICFIFSLIFYFWTQTVNGIGGALGATAFTSCLTLIILKKGHSFTRKNISRQNN